MYCRNCGKEVEDNMKFCPYCGTDRVSEQNAENIVKPDITIEKEMANVAETGSSVESEETESVKIENYPEKLVFQKGKDIGNITYKRTETEVQLQVDRVYIRQKIRKFFIMKRQNECTFLLSNIKSVSIQTKLDFWDTLYGIFFIIGGFFSPGWFLVAAIFLYCGYGKVITLEMLNGSKFQIPLKGNMEDAEKLIRYCK